MSPVKRQKKRSPEVEVPTTSDFHTTSFKIGPLLPKKFPVHPESLNTTSGGSSSPDVDATASEPMGKTIFTPGYSRPRSSKRGVTLSASPSLRRLDSPGQTSRPKSRQNIPQSPVGLHKRSMNRSNVVRVRVNTKATAVKFSVMPAEGSDPLNHKNITDAKDYRNWYKDASKALPSKVGVPIQDSDDLVQAGFSAIVEGETHRGSLNTKDSYNKVFDHLQLLKKRHTTTDIAGIEGFADSRASLLSHASKTSGKTVGSTNSATAERTYGKKLEALKMLPENLSERRRLKREMAAQVSTYAHRVRTGRMMKRYGTGIQQIQRCFHDMIKYLTIWKSSIQRIHGKFGISAGAYFEWLRTIIMLNVLYFLMTIVMIHVPEMFIDYEHGNHTVHDHKDPVVCYHHLKSCPSARNKTPSETFSLTDIFSGMGSFTNTRMYYSGYRDPQAHPFCPSKWKSHPQPSSMFFLTSFRFIILVFCIFLISSSFIAYQVTHYYHVARMTSRVPGMTKKDHFKAVLCAWDFSCTEKVAADAMHKSVWRELKDLGSQLEMLKNKKTVQPDKGSLFNFMKRFRLKEKRIHTLLHIIANIICLIALGVVSVGLYMSFYARNLWYIAVHKDCDRTVLPPEKIMILPALYISISTWVVTKICKFLGDCESWSTYENKSWAFLMRVGTYYMLIVLVLFGYWYLESHGKPGIFCHEEAMGQDIYRIVVVQGIIEIFGGFIIAHFTHVYRERKNPHYTKPPFNATKGSLSIFFVHTLSGFGFFYCPIISGVVILRLVVLFYVRKYTLMNLCSHPMHILHVSELYAPYISNFFISYLMTAIFNTILLAELHPSKNCGPFTHYWTFNSTTNITEGSIHYHKVFNKGANTTSSSIFFYMTKPAAAVVIILLLSGLVHTFRAWAKAYIVTMENLHDLLLLERKDRDFLLKAIFKLVRKSTQPGMTDDDLLQQLVDETPSQQNSALNRRKTVMYTEFAQGIFNNRNGSMSKKETFELPTLEDVSLQLQRANSEESDLWSVGSPYRDVLEEATSSAPHATFGIGEVDNWMKAFMGSKRSGRRGGEVINPKELTKIGVEKSSIQLQHSAIINPKEPKKIRFEKQSIQHLAIVKMRK